MAEGEYQIGDYLEKESDIAALKEIKEDGYKLLQYLDQSTETVIKKAHNLFQIVLVIISALIGFIMNILMKKSDWTWLSIIAVISCITLLFILFRLYKLAYSTSEFSGIGYQPKYSFQDDIFKTKKTKKNHKELLRYNLQCIQRDIDNNYSLHNNLVSRFEKITRLIVITSISMLSLILAVYFIFPFLQELFPLY